jgi:hypothetical protein
MKEKIPLWEKICFGYYSALEEFIKAKGTSKFLLFFKFLLWLSIFLTLFFYIFIAGITAFVKGIEEVQINR